MEVLAAVNGAVADVNNFATAATEIVTDAVTGVGSIQAAQSDNASVQSSHPVQQVGVADSTSGSTDDFLSCSLKVDTAKVNPAKAVLIGTATWTSNDVMYEVIENWDLPNVFFHDSNFPAYGQSRFFRFLRCGYRFHLTFNPPPGSQGCLVLSFVPPGYAHCIPAKGTATNWKFDTDALLTLPHVRCDARSTTMSSLVVPYINFNSYVDYTGSGTATAHIIVWVLGRYRCGTGTSTNIDYSVYGEMLDMDLQCPRPWDQGPTRMVVDPAPGAVMAGNSKIMNDCQTVALAGEGTLVDNTTAGAKVAKTSLLSPARHWQIMASFDWTTTGALGAQIFKANFEPFSYGNIGFLFDKFLFWRGSLEIAVLAFGSSLTSGRFQVSWYPDLSARDLTVAQVRNSIFATGDISSVATRLTIPFTNPNWRRRCDSAYGSIYVHSINRQTVNSTANPAIQMIILVRLGPDVDFFCPRYGDYHIQGDDTELIDEVQSFLNFTIKEVPIQTASHTLIPNFFGRAFYYGKYTSPAETSASVIPLKVPQYGHGSLMTMFAYFTGEVVLTVHNRGTGLLVLAHTYIIEEQHNPSDESTIFSLGAVLVPPGEVKTFACPYYAHTPLRPLRLEDTPAFGYLYASGEGAIPFTVYISLRDPKFFLDMPQPAFTSNTRAAGARVGRQGYVRSAIRLPLPQFEKERSAHEDVLLGGDVESNPGPVELQNGQQACVGFAPGPISGKEYKMQDYQHSAVLAGEAALVTHQGRDALYWFRSESVQYLEPQIDICVCGDVERNPGPKIVVVGRSGSGKSRLCNMILGHDYFPSRLSSTPVTTKMRTATLPCGTQIVDTPERFSIQEEIKGFIWVLEEGRWTQENKDFLAYMDTSYPGWRRHCVIYHTRHEDPGSNFPQFLKDAGLSSFQWSKNPLDLTSRFLMIPPYRNCLVQLVFKDRGLYKHYGARIGARIFEVNSDNLLSALTKKEVPIVSTPDDGSWQVAEDLFTPEAQRLAKNLELEKVKYGFDANCETWAKDVLGVATPCQSHVVRKACCIAVLASLGVLTLSSQDVNVMGSITSVIVSLFSKQIKTAVVRLAIKFVLRLVCYLVLYCHSPNLINTAMLSALLVMDVFDNELDEAISKFAQLCIKGDFKGLGRWVKGKVGSDCQDFDCPENRPIFNSEGPKDFNDWSLVAKNVKWWLEQFKSFFSWMRDKVFGGDSDQVDEVESRFEQITTTLAQCDAHLVAMATDKAYATGKSARQYHEVLSARLRDLSLLPLGGPLSQVSQKINYMQGRMGKVTFDCVEAGSARMEPLGIWISGGPGAGKSFLAQRIMKELKTSLGYDVYYHPTGSKHMDGYNGQEIHYIDDLGQLREEGDVALLCQMISSASFIVPKADLNSKGTLYNSKVVIATTNRTSFDTQVLTTPDALRRRFPIELSIRPHAFYCTLDGRLDMHKVMVEKAWDDCSCWEVNVSKDGRPCWQTINWDVLKDEISKQLATRMSVLTFFSQGPSLFECEEEEDEAPYSEQTKVRVSSWLRQLLDKARGFFERNKCWLVGISAVATLLSVAVSVAPKLFGNSSVYEGSPQQLKPKVYREFRSEGPNLFHLKDRLVEVGSSGSTGLILGGKQVLTYGHNMDRSFIKHKDIVYSVTKVEWIKVNDSEQDLAILTIDTNLQFKQLVNKVYSGEYHGDGYLLYFRDNSLLATQVTGIRPFDPIATQEGHITCRTYCYHAKTARGSCGGVLVGMVGGNPMVLGLHVAGNGHQGIAARVERYLWQSQGTVVKIEPGTVYHQPRRSRIVPSPVYCDSALAPAVLSRADPRLEVPVEDITKRAAAKYVGNIFKPPEDCFIAAKAHVTRLLSTVVPPVGSLEYREAIDNSILPIDWSKSPGIKYKGMSKRQCVQDQSFKRDVLHLLLAQNPEVEFVTYLKDELRKLEKIKQGKTRSIEAASFDYTIACRMLFGQIMMHLFVKGREVGFGPGINPYTEFDELFDRLHPHCLEIDYSGFDGSLSRELMIHCLDVLVSFHESPETCRKLAMLTIDSVERVSDEVWHVSGGMPSGSPLTTLMNTVCNMLMCYTWAFYQGYSCEEVFVAAYGDDVIISAKKKSNITDIVQCFKSWFGASITPAIKEGDISWAPKHQVVFLKRRPKQLDFAPKIVGALDLQNMLDRIQWTTGDFQSQLNSFYIELALHGRETYNSVRAFLANKAPHCVHPTYDTAVLTVQPIVGFL
ncbi:polyprotein [avisivirus B1]|uniref:Genome polyprotein n=10 Tax=avisivirus B1 TaxID=1534545 RepID=A0A076V8N6_9PICO|nr:polyprotein [Chicken picornavirus 2]AIK23441.1 polyprotein [Chicken picornavirus 2]